MRSLKRLRRLLPLALAMLLPQGAWAQLWGNCNINTTLPVVFGAYNPLQFSDLLAQSSVSVTCYGLGSARINLMAGLGGGGIAGRAMQNGSARLPYQLYLNAARTQVWGDGTDGTSQVNVGVFLGTRQNYQIYARIPQRQDVPVGLYTDTVQIRIDL